MRSTLPLPANGSEHRTVGSDRGSHRVRAATASHPLRRPRAPAQLRGPGDAHRGAHRALVAAALQRRAAGADPPVGAGRRAATSRSRWPSTRHHDTFGKRNDAFIRVGLDVGEAAIRDGLARAGLAAGRRRPPLLRHRDRPGHAVARRPPRQPALAQALGEADAHLRPRLPGAAPPAWRGPPTRCAPSRTRWPSCSRWSSARSPSSPRTSPSPTWWPPASSATAPRPWCWAAGRGRPRPRAPRILATRSVFYPGHRVGHGLGRGRHRLQGGPLGQGARR